jgi:hypothetical protein
MLSHDTPLERDQRIEYRLYASSPFAASSKTPGDRIGNPEQLFAGRANMVVGESVCEDSSLGGCIEHSLVFLYHRVIYFENDSNRTNFGCVLNYGFKAGVTSDRFALAGFGKKSHCPTLTASQLNNLPTTRIALMLEMYSWLRLEKLSAQLSSSGSQTLGGKCRGSHYVALLLGFVDEEVRVLHTVHSALHLNQTIKALE